MFTKRKFAHIFLSVIVLLTMTVSSIRPSSVSAQDGDGIQREVNAGTGKVSFIGPENGRTLLSSEALGVSPSSDPAQALANRFAPEFGVQNPERDLTASRSQETDEGRVTVRYQQSYEGIPVMGGELVVNTNENGDLYSMNGEVSSNLSLQTQPTIDPAQASETALGAMAKWYQASSDDFATSEPELWVFDESLLKPSDHPAELVWRMEVTPKDNSLPVRELVLVNAHRGGISLHFNQVDEAWGETQIVKSPKTEVVKPETTTPKVADTSSAKTTKDLMPNLLGNTWYVATTGNDSNDCATTSTPCITINGAINKAMDGDTIQVATGTYTGGGTEVVLINKSIILSGGWTSDFSTQNGMSTIDGQGERQGIGAYGTTMEVDHFIIQNGKADSGGGIVNGATLILSYSIVTNNTSTVFSGGGISNDGTLTLNNSTVNNNSSIGILVNNWGGAGISNTSFGTISINNTTISGNSTTGFGGGGIFNYGGVVTVNNSTISNNMALSGGGIYNNSGSISSAEVAIKNTILADNKTASGDYDCVGVVSVGYNIVGNADNCNFTANTGDIVGTSTNPINPHLTPLQDNGGPTFTHALMVGSPAIDAGNPATPGSGGNACLATDQRGVVRPDGARCDIGAYEGSVPLVPNPLVRTYTATNGSKLPGTLLCNQTQPTCPSGDNHAKKAHQYAIGTYNFYAAQFNRDSIDNNGMIIKSTVHYKNNYDNAFWNGKQMVYGDANGYPLADDIVAHELTHGVTQYESGLFYYYQSGAIDESLADVWGEYYDQTNGLGNDANNVKWLLGEDVTGLGAFRNMKNPPQFSHPDKMTSPNYVEDIGDSGGVHSNSGVNNKAVYLMVDGGAFNGKTITKLGWTKTAAIYYEANTNLLTSGSDYSDLYFALQQACSNLIGQKGITSADCVQVKNALLAVEMNTQPASNFNPDAAFCPTGLTTGDSLNLYKDDFENGSTQWTPQPAWSIEDWYATSPTHMFYGDDAQTSSDSSLKMKTRVTLPAGSQAYLHFKHAFLFDYVLYQGQNYYFDGGVLEYSINNGSTWIDAKTLFSAGQNYKGVIYNYSGTTNKLKGRSAFVGDSHGYVSSLYDLSSLAGKKIQFRWRMATDSTVSFLGWFVDDVQIYTCIGKPSKPVLSSPASNALVTDYTPDLDWSDSTPAPVTYQIQIADNDKFTSPAYNKKNLPTSDFTVPADLVPNATYFWRVRAYNVLNKPGAWSTPLKFRTVMTPPVLLTPTDGETTANLQPLLDWEDTAGATKYVLQVSDTSNFSNKLVNLNNLTESTYQIPSDLPATATIYWRVRATGPNGPSAWSTFSFFTP